MRTLGAVSVVVPTYNEAENVSLLLARLDATMRAAHLAYQIIFIDDHSTDGTRDLLRSLQDRYPLELYLKRGKRGKAFSLMEGFGYVKYDTVCMIDADLQYPPEAIVSMYELMQLNSADIILSRRVDNATGWLRKLATAAFNTLFTRLLFGFDYDTQSGLKLFDRKLLGTIKVTPSPWSFDLEFIVRSMEHNYSILSYDIPFSERYAGEAKVNVLTTSFELAWAAITLRIDTSIKDVRRAYRRNMKLAEKALGCLLIAVIGGLLFAVQPARAVTPHAALLKTAGGAHHAPIIQADSKLSAATISVQPAAGTQSAPAASPAPAATPDMSPVTSPQPASDATAAMATPASATAAPLTVRALNYGATTPTATPATNMYVVPAKVDTKGINSVARDLIIAGVALLVFVSGWYAVRHLRPKKVEA